MDFDEEVVQELTVEQCWAALGDDELGRLAFRLGDEVHIAPVNYVVDGETLLFMTAEGSKLLGVLMHPEVAFEVDRRDGPVAHSVVVRGTARRLEEDEAHRAEDLGLRPWTDTLKYDVVEIVPAQVTGRRFTLNR
jgi:nitroimidazol reductase NimA-like FMN-containing flavoprotein (pyridoxamine 5'-phosphate oxidase superfamily)